MKASSQVEVVNPKFEVRNPKQTLNPNSDKAETERPSSFEHFFFELPICLGLRISDFGLKILSSISARSTLIAALVLAFVTLVVYWPVRHFDFVQYDDNDYVFDNQTVRAGLTWWGLVWSFVDAHALNWHPLTWLSHMLDCQLFGLNPGAHHLVNVLLHCANTALLFVLLRTMTADRTKAPRSLGSSLFPSRNHELPLLGERVGVRGNLFASLAPRFMVRGNLSGDSARSNFWRCAFVAALFAWHPLRVESVAWISERKDVLSGFFFMLTLLAYVRFAKAQRNREKTLSLIFFTLGLLSKPMLVTVPFILLLLDYWPLGRFSAAAACGTQGATASIKHLFREKIPFFALSLAVAIITFFSQRSGGAMISLDSEGIGTRIATICTGYLGYLEKTFWPRDLAVIYLRPHSVPASTTILGAAILLSLTVLAIRSLFNGIRSPQKTTFNIQTSKLSIGWLWFLIMLLPVCGLVQVGSQLLADRYTYLPSIGVAILIAWTLPDLLMHLFNVLTLQRFNALALQRLTLALLLLACALLTRHQLAYWRNTETLMTRALTVDPNNYIAHQDLAVYYSKLGQIDAARAHRQMFRELDPSLH